MGTGGFVQAMKTNIKNAMMKFGQRCWIHFEKPALQTIIFFRYGLKLFGYFETDDLIATQTYLAGSLVNAKWAEWMAPIMKIDVDPQTNFPYPFAFAIPNLIAEVSF